MIRWIVFLAFLLTIGCSRSLTVLTEQVEYVNISDFSGGSIDVVTDEDLTTVRAVEDEVWELQKESVILEEAEVKALEFDASMMPTEVGVEVTVEALVGQVNGRPIYANKVLAPVSDRIKVAATQMTRTLLKDEVRAALFSEANQMGTTIRGGRLYDLVVNDLLLSEAVSGMSKRQPYGLISIVSQMREDLVSSQGGSQTQLRQILEQQEGVSVDEYVEFQRDQILIDALDSQKIWPKVNVTWRDIQREFEQVSQGNNQFVGQIDRARTDAIILALRQGVPLGDIPEANGSVTLGRIALKKDDPRVRETMLAFANGSEFEEVCELLELENGGLWKTFEMGSGGIDDISVNSTIKSHLVGVSKGEIVEPFELGSNVVWIAILEVQEPVSLYNRRVQIEVENILRWNQFNREKVRYVESLWGEGSIEEVKAMADRVANIAVQRYQR
jgi:hypothetical protein